MKETEPETQKGVQAELNVKQRLENQSEFFERLDFLVTFWAMQKVTCIPSLRAQRNINLTFTERTSKIMETKRQKQINELLRRQFSMVLLDEGTYIYDRAMVTVTRVVVSPDLQSAKVYLSVFNTENKMEVMAAMDENIHRLRHPLAGKVAKQLRKIPELKFFLDDSLDEFFRMDQILTKLRAENQMGTEEE